MSVDIDIDQDLWVEFSASDEWTCHLTLYHGDEEVMSVPSASNPWEPFSRTMITNVVLKQIDGYDSREAFEDLLGGALEERKPALAELVAGEEARP